ncbi:S9 family peptidase [Jiangella endophytica]|uniref:S9 family peptidase n=1 Tax=Jiangella endophytica TaxID=1623398 RepID=UPI000E346ACC|nr:DPP IV N-terminal domain-containing protein [Jiangella endophytica]
MSTGHDGFDRFFGGLDRLAPGGTVVPAWSPDARWLAFIDGPADDRQGWLADCASGERKPLVPDVSSLRESIRHLTGETPAGRGLPFDHVIFAADAQVEARVGGVRVRIELDSGKAERLADGEEGSVTPREFLRPRPLIDPAEARELASPGGALLASMADGNVVVRSTIDGRVSSLTSDGTPEHDYRFDLVDSGLASLGMAFPVCNWSPDGSRLAVSRVDSRGVHRAPQVHYLNREEEVVHRYCAQAGGQLERTTLHVLDVFGRPAVQLDLGDTTDTYPVPAAWLPDGRHLIVFVMSRDCRRIDVVLADAQTGATRPIFREVGDSFLRIHHDVYYASKIGLFLTPDGAHVLWLSERSGWKHLYLYDLEGTLVRQLTDGEWPVDYVHHVDDDHVYFTAHIDTDRPYDTHLARVRLDGGPVEQLTSDPGAHSMVMAPRGDVLVDTWSTVATAPRSVLRSVDGSLLAELSTADTSGLAWTPTQEFTVLAADGETELWGAVFFPADFDETRTYPLVEYVYGGPQWVAAPHSFDYGAFGRHAHALAQLGYIVFVVDGRGTPGRSKAFHDVVYGDWTAGLVPDHAAAALQLKERYSFLSESPVAVIGYSWGGYAAFRLAAERPDVYGAAVSLAAGFDPYSLVLYECYLGLPQANPQAYRKAETYPLAHSFASPFLLACGSADHPQWPDVMKMSETLIRAGKEHEFVVLPGQIHALDAVHAAYFWRKVRTFLAAHLAAG